MFDSMIVIFENKYSDGLRKILLTRLLFCGKEFTVTYDWQSQPTATGNIQKKPE